MDEIPSADAARTSLNAIAQQTDACKRTLLAAIQSLASTNELLLATIQNLAATNEQLLSVFESFTELMNLIKHTGTILRHNEVIMDHLLASHNDYRTIVIKVLKESRQRLVFRQLVEGMIFEGVRPSPRHLKRVLASLIADGIVDRDFRARPPGYGLAHLRKQERESE